MFCDPFVGAAEVSVRNANEAIAKEGIKFENILNQEYVLNRRVSSPRPRNLRLLLRLEREMTAISIDSSSATLRTCFV